MLVSIIRRLTSSNTGWRGSRGDPFRYGSLVLCSTASEPVTGRFDQLVIARGHPLGPLIFLPDQARSALAGYYFPRTAYTGSFRLIAEHGANKGTARTNYLLASSRRDRTMQLRSDAPVERECPLGHIQTNFVRRSGSKSDWSCAEEASRSATWQQIFSKCLICVGSFTAKRGKRGLRPSFPQIWCFRAANEPKSVATFVIRRRRPGILRSWRCAAPFYN